MLPTPPCHRQHKERGAVGARQEKIFVQRFALRYD